MKSPGSSRPSVALYLRVSSEAQVKKDLSLPAQERELSDLCKARGWDIVRVYKEPGVTGTVDARPVFQQMMTDATSKNPPFSIVVVYAVDRFGRSVMDGVNVRKLSENGIHLFCKAENIFADDNKFIFGVYGLMGQAYSDRLRVVVKRGQQEATLRGQAGTGLRNMFGYRAEAYINENGKPQKRLVPDPQTAPFVKKLFQRYANGDSCKELARWLTSMIPTQAERTGKSPRGKTHGTWLEATVRKILGNPIYTGYTYYGRRTVTKLLNGSTRTQRNPPDKWTRSKKPTHGALVSQELFNKVQAKLNSGVQFRAREGRPVNVIQEIGRCKNCDSSLSFEDNGPKNGSKMYYFCRARRRYKLGGEKCAGGFPHDVVEEAIFDTLSVVLTPELIHAGVMTYNRASRAMTESDEIRALELRVTDLKKKEANLIALAAEQGDIPAVAEALRNIHAALESAQNSLSNLRSQAAEKVIDLDPERLTRERESLRVAIGKLDRAAIKTLLPHLVSRVTLDFSKRRAATKFWRLDSFKEHFGKSKIVVGKTYTVTPAMAKRLREKARRLSAGAEDAIRVWMRYDLKNLKSLTRDQLEKIGAFKSMRQKKYSESVKSLVRS